MGELRLLIDEDGTARKLPDYSYEFFFETKEERDEFEQKVRDLIKSKEIFKGPMPDDAAKKCRVEFLELEKHKWHDLRKNPDDLPEEEGEYLVAFIDYDEIYNEFNYEVMYYRKYEIGTMRFESYWGWRHEENIVAWKYIEPFE